MDISSISSASSMMNFQALEAPTSTQTSVSTLVSQLEDSISSGNLDSTQTILQSIKSIAPLDSGTSDPLSTFLSSVSTAVKDNSTSEAETALATYQTATAKSSESSDATNAENLAVGKELMEDKLTLSMVKMALDPQDTTTTSSSSTSDSSTTTDSTSTSTDSTGTTDDSSLSTSSLTSDDYETGTLYSAAA